MKIHELKKEEVSKYFTVFRTNNFVMCISQLISLRWRNEGRYICGRGKDFTQHFRRKFYR